MIFRHTRTRRISVRLIELTLGQGMELAKLPAERPELTVTELLRFVAKDAEQPRPHYVTDPLLMTAEERTLLVVNYLAHVTDEGPDFPVGDAKLSDYVMFDRDSKVDFVDLGAVAGKEAVMRPLLGLHAQTLEMVCKTRGAWIIGAIACQMSVKGMPEPDWASMSDVAVMEWVEGRMARIKELPESMFEEMFEAYYRGAEQLSHFFFIDFDDSGLVFRAVDKEVGHSPARFLAASCISGISQTLAR